MPLYFVKNRLVTMDEFELIKYSLKLHLKFDSETKYKTLTKYEDEKRDIFTKHNILKRQYIDQLGKIRFLNVFYLTNETPPEHIICTYEDARIKSRDTHLEKTRSDYYILDVDSIINDEIKILLDDLDVTIINDHGLVKKHLDNKKNNKCSKVTTSYKETIIELLDNTNYKNESDESSKASKSDHTKYENIISLIFDAFFECFDVPHGEREHKTNNGGMRTDIVYDISRIRDRKLSKLFERYESDNLLIECKNTESINTIKEGFDQIGTYLRPNNYGNIGIMVVRKRPSDDPMWLDKYKTFFSDDKLLLILEDDDLKYMINSSVLNDDDYPLILLHRAFNKTKTKYS